MDIRDIKNISDEETRVKAIYNVLNEDIRLRRSRAAGVEFFTTVKYIERHLKEGMRILELGAGTGAYSLYFARKGYQVTAVELSERNADIFRSRIKNNMNVQLYCRNALDLSPLQDKYFDIVLVFGPLYHLASEKDRERCINEAKRVCKDDGTMFFSFISNDMTVLSEINQNPRFLSVGQYEKNTFKVSDFPFVLFDPKQCGAMINNCGIEVTAAIGTDGIGFLMEDKINAMDEYSFNQYLKFHFYCCEKPEMLGSSMHLLFIGKKI